jgi:hypothetical protein
MKRPAACRYGNPKGGFVTASDATPDTAPASRTRSTPPLRWSRKCLSTRRRRMSGSVLAALVQAVVPIRGEITRCACASTKPGRTHNPRPSTREPRSIGPLSIRPFLATRFSSVESVTTWRTPRIASVSIMSHIWLPASSRLVAAPSRKSGLSKCLGRARRGCRDLAPRARSRRLAPRSSAAPQSGGLPVCRR